MPSAPLSTSHPGSVVAMAARLDLPTLGRPPPNPVTGHVGSAARTTLPTAPSASAVNARKPALALVLHRLHPLPPKPSNPVIGRANAEP